MVADTVQTSKGDDLKNKQQAAVAVSTPNKELEPNQKLEQTSSEEEILSEIVKTSEAADEQAEAKVKENLAIIRQEHDGKLTVPAPKLAPDVADSGVKAPQSEANEVITKGTTLSVEMTEDEFSRGMKGIVSGKKSIEKVVFGVPSLIAFAFWVGRMIKKAHGHAMKVVFKRGGQ